MRPWITRMGIVGLALATGCGGDSFTPTEETVAGSYSATVLTLTTGGQTTDYLALGATVDLTLAADGTTTGRLFVPGGAEGGGNLDADLAGTWDLNGRVVTFNQTADTFIRDSEFSAGENTLTGQEIFSGTTVRLVLARVSAGQAARP